MTSAARPTPCSSSAPATPAEGTDYRAAADTLQQSLELYRHLNDQLGQGNALNFQGYVWQLPGDYPRAIAAQQEALAIYRDLANRQGQANALNFLGTVWPQTGNPPPRSTPSTRRWPSTESSATAWVRPMRSRT